MKSIPNVRFLKNILILRGEGSLGDALISSCCYREIKRTNPKIKISVACFGSAYGYLKELPYIDKIYRLPIPRVLRPNQRWLTLLWYALKLRRKHFDLVLDTSLKPFANWTLFKHIIGGDKVLDYYTSPIPFGQVPGRCVDHEQAVLAQLGVVKPNKSYEIPLQPAKLAKRDAFLKQHIADYEGKGYILLNPFGSIAARSLDKMNIHRILKELAARTHLPAIIPCMPSQKARAQAYLQGVRQGVLLYETDSVFDLFALVAGAKVVITPDTAVVHIASGLRKPTVAFYNSYSIANDPDNLLARIIHTAPASVNLFEFSAFETALAGLL